MQQKLRVAGSKTYIMLPKFINVEAYLDFCHPDIYSNHLLVIIKDKTVPDNLGLATVAQNSHLPLQKLTSLTVLLHLSFIMINKMVGVDVRTTNV